MTFQLPEIQISPNLYTILKIVFMVGAFITICFNVLSINASVPPNTTDWNWGIVEGIKDSGHGYPEDYYDENGYPTTQECDCELTDDDLEEEEEIEDEKLHLEESEEYDNNNNSNKEED